MSVPLAWRNATNNKSRTFLALSAITFAIALIFMQLALFETCELSAAILIDMMDFDILVTSSQYYCIQQPGAFPRTRLPQCLEVAEVASAVPVYFTSAPWRNVNTGKRYPPLVIAASPVDPVFVSPEIRAGLPLLHRTNTVLMDRRALPMFGPVRTQLVSEMGSQNVEVVGLFSNGGGFGAACVFVVSDQTYVTLGNSPEHVTFGLVKLRPGADRAGAVHALQKVLPADSRAITRDDLLQWERRYWIKIKPIGIMFSSGVYVGIVVGAVILYQVLASDIINRLKEYATMKALGYTPLQINWTVMQQALIYAGISYLVGLTIAFGLYWLISNQAGIPLVMTLARAGSVFGLTMLMCLGSGVLALRKLYAADPADLF